jgi:hypothetical protein
MSGEPSDSMYMPQAEVRNVTVACRPVRKTEVVDWSINGCRDCGANQTFLLQLEDRAGAQRIKDEGEPKETADGGGALGPKRVGLGFGLGLTFGLVVHGGRVTQKERFNRRKRSERRKENYGVGV